MTDLAKIIDIANPEESKVAVVLLLDNSGSMSENDKINQLNKGLKTFKEDIIENDLARKRVEVAIITFGDEVKIIHDFSSIEQFEPPYLKTDGLTPMGDAILKAFELIEERKEKYRKSGINYYRPWIFMITDGEPTDMEPGDKQWETIKKLVHIGEEEKKFLFFSVAVNPANMEILNELSLPDRPPVKLKITKFKELFKWLSDSLISVSSSKVGEQVALPSIGWAEISI